MDEGVISKSISRATRIKMSKLSPTQNEAQKRTELKDKLEKLEFIVPDVGVCYSLKCICRAC